MHFSALINFNWIYLVYINFFCKKKNSRKWGHFSALILSDADWFTISQQLLRQKKKKKMHNSHFIIQYSNCSNINNISNINNKIRFLFNTIELQYASIPVSRLDYDIIMMAKQMSLIKNIGIGYFALTSKESLVITRKFENIFNLVLFHTSVIIVIV